VVVDGVVLIDGCLLDEITGVKDWMKLMHTHHNFNLNLKPWWTRLSKMLNRCATSDVLYTHNISSLSALNSFIIEWGFHRTHKSDFSQYSCSS